MNRLKEHAIREFLILESKHSDAVVLEFKKEILKLVENFGKSGQSGGSAPYVASAISDTVKSLLGYSILCPLTGEISEWEDTEGGYFQNVRYSSVFKEVVNGTSYFIKAIVFKNNDSSCFTGSVYSEDFTLVKSNNRKIESRQDIPYFPFTPKSFYIDVEQVEITKYNLRINPTLEYIEYSDGRMYITKIKDSKQLEEVYKYYSKENNIDENN